METKAEIFLNREDIVKLYVDSRKSVSEEEIEDLLNCVIGFIKQETKSNRNYAIKLGNLGFIHRDFNKEKKTKKTIRSNTELLDNMLIDICTKYRQNHPLISKSKLKLFYKKKNIEEVERIQNNVE